MQGRQTKTMRKIGGLFLGVLLVACTPAPKAADPKPAGPAPDRSAKPYVARPEAPGVRGQCSFAGWSSDRDPKGLNVRAGPSPDAPIVGVLPPPAYDPDMERTFATEFVVVEAKNGWFRITHASRFSDEGEPAYGSRYPENRERPSGLPSGWIDGRYVTFGLETGKAFAEPDPSSRVVAREWKGSRVEYPFPARHPSDCQGRWVKMLVTPEGGPETSGWVRGICRLQETTCAGSGGDYDE